MPICGGTVSDYSKAGVGNVFPRNNPSSLWNSGVGADWRGLRILCGPNVQTLVSCHLGVGCDTPLVTIWNILCAALAMAVDKLRVRSIGAVMRFVYQHLLSGVNSGIGGNLESLAICLSIRSDKFLRANSNAICRFSLVEWADSSVVVDMPTWGILKIISIGNLACRPDIKKNGVSCTVELKDVL